MKNLIKILVCVAVFWPALAFAQSSPALMMAAVPEGVGADPALGPAPAEPGLRENPKFWERIEELRFYKLIKFLGLSTEEANRLAPEVQSLEKSRRDYFRERDRLLDRLAELLEKKASETELSKTIAEIRKLDEAFLAKEKEATNRILKILPPEKEAKYYLFNRHFAREMRQEFSRLVGEQANRPHLRKKMRERRKP